ncbi:T9SS type A sorting domain-containing protein [Flavobacteriales bacterium]|nr:T9SS type A sorting domain-containing protein [Flavobacteriales bacterium]MDB4655415.1 T9SS type A sorting domain-containing protein [Flavobacteriales bacterium]
MTKFYATLLLAFVFSVCATAQQTSVLFVGNSYIYTQNLPGTLYNLALAGGDTIYHESSTPGGYTLQGHSTNSTTLTKIASRDWDFVVLQEQSQKPSFPPAQVASETYPYAEVLVDSIKSNYECSEPIFFMTWGRRDGDAQNCQFYPPLCTFEGMNGRLRESYLEMSSDNNATAAPCGAAWHQMSIDNPTFFSGLYSGDGSHPSAWGTYLNACVFYATIFRESPVGIPYYSSIGQQDAEDLQQLAEDIVLDSLSSWYIGHADDVSIDIDYMQIGGVGNGPDVQFINNSTNAVYHDWDFGDGGTSDEAAPFYNFSQGSWAVNYIGSSCSETESSSLQILVPLSVVENDPFNSLKMMVTTIGIHVSNDQSTDLELTGFDNSGRMLWSEQIARGASRTFDTPKTDGVYLIRVSDGEQTITRKFFIQ